MANKKYIAFDESGNTGSDLLDKNQPVFVLASVRLTLDEARELKSVIKTNSEELKFNRLKKYHKNQQQIISLLNHEIISDDSVKLALFHKDYCICVHTIDRIIEPLAYRDGFDFYKGGLNLAFANLLYYCVPVFCNPSIWEQYKVDFINLFQNRDTKSIINFYSTVESLIESCKDDEFSSILSPILGSYQIIHKILSNWDTNNFDATLTGFINLVDYWGRKSNNSFYAYVDKSKALEYFKPLVDRVKSINSKQELGADRRSLSLPLKLIDIKFDDSKDNIIVQIADLIAGASYHYYRALANQKYTDNFSEMIGNTKLVNLLHSPVWPHKGFTSDELDIVDNGKSNLLDSLVKLNVYER